MRDEKRMDQNLRIQNHTFLVGLQETKSMEVKGSLDKDSWGPNPFQREVSHPQGLSVGIVTLWNPEKFLLAQSSSDQGYLIIKGIWRASKENYAFVNVYTPNDPNRRQALWRKLEMEINSGCDTC